MGAFKASTTLVVRVEFWAVWHLAGGVRKTDMEPVRSRFRALLCGTCGVDVDRVSTGTRSSGE